MSTVTPRFGWLSSDDWLECLERATLAAAAALVLFVPAEPAARAPLPITITATPVRHTADFGGQTASSEARQVADWVAQSSDNRRLSFIILDKREARVFVFDADARLLGASPVLLGAAPGDDSVTGIGKRPIAQVRPEERTTPAGRFEAEPGRNTAGEDVLWVDYDAAVSMHRVRVVDIRERRLERLASPSPADRRISYGCINVPVRFFEDVVSRTFSTRRGVVYVLPEVKPLRTVFPAV